MMVNVQLMMFNKQELQVISRISSERHFRKRCRLRVVFWWAGSVSAADRVSLKYLRPAAAGSDCDLRAACGGMCLGAAFSELPSSSLSKLCVPFDSFNVPDHLPVQQQEQRVEVSLLFLFRLVDTIPYSCQHDASGANGRSCGHGRGSG
jgi:hypothetical protein